MVLRCKRLLRAWKWEQDKQSRTRQAQCNGQKLKRSAEKAGREKEAG